MMSVDTLNAKSYEIDKSKRRQKTDDSVATVTMNGVGLGDVLQSAKMENVSESAGKPTELCLQASAHLISSTTSSLADTPGDSGVQCLDSEGSEVTSQALMSHSLLGAEELACDSQCDPVPSSSQDMTKSTTSSLCTLLCTTDKKVTRMGGMLYVVLPSEISTKALKILVEYMYKGETTVSNEVLDTVLKAGEVLKIRGLWRQTDEAGGDTTAEKQQPAATTSLNKAPTPAAAKKTDADVVQVQAKIAVKKDDKLLKTFGPLQPQGGTGRPMFIGPPKLVFIKTNEGGAQMALRPGAPKGQTILVAPAPQQETTTITIPSTPSPERESPMEISAPKSPRVLRRQTERKYGKRNRTEANNDEDKSKDGESTDESTNKR